MLEDLQNKVVLITGASTGIGAAAARAFARQRSRVAIHYNSSKTAAEAVLRDVENAGAQGLLVHGDVTSEADIRRIVQETVAAFGRIDVLINNAGGMVDRVRTEDYDASYIDAVLRLNAVQVALFSREIIPLMRGQKAGSIINVSSVAARQGGGIGAVIYAGSKGFIATATKGWAKECVADGIRVNAVSPGVIMTPFHERHSTPEALKRMQSNIPMGRLGTPDDCTGAFLFLASDTMSGFITGQVLEVNGGQFMA
jgi:3-oxoacyl-[acyl-carrier protein] reductase